MIIGICGGSGSGKTTILNRLYTQFKALDPSVFSMDNYYRSIDEQEVDVNGEVNFDLPSALDEPKLTSDLQRLVKGEQIIVKEYHFNSPPDKHVLITIDPSKLLIVEGLFLFHYPGVKEVLDYTIFIDVDQKIQLDRRLYRDQETRGYTREAILYQWENHVTPCFDNYLLPYRNDADFLFRNDSKSDEDFEKLSKEIAYRMEEQNAW
ncbi:MAG: uridine kinase [Crocinitomicaceae bacterium]|jgi:uridine kinase